MPIEDDKTTVEGGAQPAAEAAPAPKKKSGKMLFAGIGVVAIVVGIALALFVIKPMMADSGSGEGDSAKVEAKADSHGSKKSGGKSHGSEALIHEISNIVVNPAGTGGSRFLSASFGFELESPALLQEFQQKEPVIRDALITILSSKTVAQLTDPKQKEIVRYQIRKRVSQIMNTESVAGVYYTDFVLQ